MCWDKMGMEGRATQADVTSIELLESLRLKHGVHGSGSEGAQSGLSEIETIGRGHSISENCTLGHALSCLVSKNCSSLNIDLRPFGSSLKPITSAHVSLKLPCSPHPIMIF